jgi:hypothetical protein
MKTSGQLRARLLGAAALLTAPAMAVALTTVPAGATTATTSAGEPYSCGSNGNAVAGTFGDAGVIGWAGDNGVVACLGGSFYIKNGAGTTSTGSFNDAGTTYGFGVYDYSSTTWVNAQGYLPALVTTFTADGATVAITNFVDRDVIDGSTYDVVYSRVAVHNPTTAALNVDPEPSAGLVPLSPVSSVVAPGATVDHDYAVVADDLGLIATPVASSPATSTTAPASGATPTAPASTTTTAPASTTTTTTTTTTAPAANTMTGLEAAPPTADLVAAGTWQSHFTHMQTFWQGQLAQIATLVHLPDASLVDAYQAGFIDNEIIRSGDMLFTGANGYTMEYSHDVIGLLAAQFTEGEFDDARSLLERADTVVGTQTQYADGLWTYSWPWAVYLEKTGDLAFVESYFSNPGPAGAATEPSIEATAHDIAADRTGPGGIMEETNDIDANGYWTIDNYEALMGLAAYRYLAQQVGDTTEVSWATTQYSELLAAVNRTLTSTIATNHLSYLPCSMVEADSQNRCANPEDANWAATYLFGRWAWDGYLFDAPRSGPGLSLIDATYTYGFNRLSGKLPADTYGGYSPDFWSTAYNAGYGEWGLASAKHRDQGILGYQWSIANDQSGPYSFWESSSAPNTGSPWVGTHPASGNGASPHAWGIANANMVLLNSLVAQRSSGQVIVGRGVPDAWVAPGKRISVDNVPIAGGQRMGLTVTTSGLRVTLELSGSAPAGDVLFQLPAFNHDIAATTTGTVDQASGTVTVPGSTRTVTVTLRRAV